MYGEADLGALPFDVRGLRSKLLDGAGDDTAA